MKTEPKDTYQRITEHIASAIERGAGTYVMPWHTVGSAGLPMNASRHAPYQGVNVLSLWISQQLRGYDSNLWASYRQWAELGAQVKRGEKATPICFFRELSGRSEVEAEEEGEKEHASKRRVVARTYWVFNANQVEGYKPPEVEVPKLSESERLFAAEKWLFGVGADIRYGGDRAFYSLSGDYIQLPPYERFKSGLGFYSTTAHELTHWTGNNTRVGREFGKRFGDKAYAAEELVAELGAAFLLARLGLSSEPRPDHAQYIDGWLSLLRGDSRAIFTASAAAGAACDWLHERHVEFRETELSEKPREHETERGNEMKAEDILAAMAGWHLAGAMLRRHRAKQVQGQESPGTATVEDEAEAKQTPRAHDKLSPETLTALTQVIDYLWEAEAADYEVNPRPDHIFKKLSKLRDLCEAKQAHGQEEKQGTTTEVTGLAAEQRDFVETDFVSWVEKYRPVQDELHQPRLYETLGSDLETVRKADPNTVWTLVEEGGTEMINSGFQLVNRVGYFITQEPFPDHQDLSVTLPRQETQLYEVRVRETTELVRAVEASSREEAKELTEEGWYDCPPEYNPATTKLETTILTENGVPVEVEARRHFGEKWQPTNPDVVTSAAESNNQEINTEMQMPLSEERAQRFAELLPSYPEDEHTNVIDILADAQRWCKREGVDFSQILRSPSMHFAAEAQKEAPASEPVTGTKRYTVRVETVCPDGEVEVEAGSQQEAESLAREYFVPESTSTILTENGVPVEWSSEAFNLDPENPYRPTSKTLAEEPNHQTPEHLGNEQERSKPMSAWRPYRNVIEGELDNTTPGRVMGWISFVGLKEPVTFDLTGNFHRDIRGAKIHIKNPSPVEQTQEMEEYMEGFATHQTGVVGDITAGLPPHDYADYPYIEWYSDQNGRIVLELDPQQVEVIGTPLAWETEEPISREQQGRNMGNFLAKLSEELSVPAMVFGQPPDEAERPEKMSADTKHTEAEEEKQRAITAEGREVVHAWSSEGKPPSRETMERAEQAMAKARRLFEEVQARQEGAEKQPKPLAAAGPQDANRERKDPVTKEEAEKPETAFPQTISGNKKESEDMAENQNEKDGPLYDLRSGRIQGCIWDREGPNGETRYSVSLARSYRDKDGNWQRVSSFDPEDLPRVKEVLARVEQILKEELGQDITSEVKVTRKEDVKQGQKQRF